VCRLLTDDHNMWEASAPSVERFMRRELGPEARVRDALEELDRLKDAILALPQTVEQMGAVADTLAKSREAEPNSGSEGRWLLRAVAGAGLVAIGALGAVWVTGAI
jgi:ubiquinone biosynthesis protein